MTLLRSLDGFLKMLVLMLILELALPIAAASPETLTITMPDFYPSVNTHLCVARSVPNNTDYYIGESFSNLMSPNFCPVVGFKPIDQCPEHNYHRTLFACGEAERHDIWNCNYGELPDDPDFPSGPACDMGKPIINIFGWQSGDREFNLPPGIGFKVGPSTGLNDLVLTKHFWHQDRCPGGKDNGYELTMIPVDEAEDYKSASQLAMETTGRIPAKSVSDFEMAFPIKENVTLHPFAFNVHTHEMGTSISVWKIDGLTGQWIHWTTFNPIANRHHVLLDQDLDLTLSRGDVLAVRCTFNNTLDHEARIGNKLGYEEMCQFYLLFYVDQGSVMPTQMNHRDAGPPDYD